MRIEVYTYVLLLISCLCLSCEAPQVLGDSEEETTDTESPESSISLQVKAYIEGRNAQELHSVWYDDDALGIYISKNKGAEYLVENAMYVTRGEGVFRTNATSDALAKSKAKLDLVGYYPYRSDVEDNKYKIDLSNQNNQQAIDFMFSNNTKGIYLADGEAEMVFKRKLAKVVLVISTDNANIDLSNLKVSISQTPLTAEVDLRTGAIGRVGTTGDLFFNVKDKGTVAEAIILPTPTLDGWQLYFGVGKSTYVVDLEETNSLQSFEEGKLYVLSVVIGSDNNIAIKSASIQGWTIGAREDVVAHKDNGGHSPMHPKGDGTKENPYLVSTAIELKEQTNVWVVGYIVGTPKGQGPTYNWGLEGAKETAITLGETPDTQEEDKVMPVQLPSGDIRKTLNLKSNPSNLGKKVAVCANITTYYGGIGLKEITDFEFISEE